MKDTVSKNFAAVLRRYMRDNDLTQTELAAKLGVTPAAVSLWVTEKKTPPAARLAEICTMLGASVSDIMTTPKTVPILGQVGAGIPLYAEENIIGWEEISPSLEGDYFALRIHGDSMSPRMQDGDIVICKRQDTAEDGDIVIAVGGSEALCKRIRLYKDGIELCSINPAYRPLSFSKAEVKSIPILIIGKAVEVRGKL